MNDPSTYWLTMTNLALGVVVLICCGAVAFGVLQELIARKRKRAAESTLDREVADLAATYTGGHAFHLHSRSSRPGAGVNAIPHRKRRERSCLFHYKSWESRLARPAFRRNRSGAEGVLPV